MKVVDNIMALSRFEVYATFVIMSKVFWDMTPYDRQLITNRHGITYQNTNLRAGRFPRL